MSINSKPLRFPIEPFRWDADDPLALEHDLVSRLVSETLKSDWTYYKDLDLNATEAGRKMSDAEPEMTTRLVMACVAHAVHFDRVRERRRSFSESESERLNWHNSPEWKSIWIPRLISSNALRRLMRRKLPFNPAHLLELANWILSPERPNDSFYPLIAFVKAIVAYGEVGPGESELRQRLEHLAKVLRRSGDNNFAKLAQDIQSVLESGASAVEDDSGPPKENCGPLPSELLVPTMVGSQNVLVQLKQYFSMAPPDEVASTEVGFDHFLLRADSPLKAEHEEISKFLPEVVERPGYHSPDLMKTDTGRVMLAGNEYTRGRLLLAAAERCVSAHFVRGDGLLADHRCWQSQAAVTGVFAALERTAVKFDRDDLFDVLLFLSARSGYELATGYPFIEELLQQVETFAAESPLTAGERHLLHRLRCRSVRTCSFGGRPTPEVARFTSLLGGDFYMVLVPGEAWSDAVNSDLARLTPPERIKWAEVFGHASTATASRPSAKWLKTAREVVGNVGGRSFSESLQRWFPLVNSPRTIRLLPGGGMMGRSDLSGTIHEDNATCLRGLLWMSPEISSPDLVRAVGALTVSCYRKIPGIGPRAVKAGNAGVYALSQVNDPLAVGQLALLKVKVKFGTAQKEIEKAFNVAAERSGLPREELEEMSVPTYGLTDVGVGEETMGDFTARLTVTGTTSTELVWVKPDGKIQRAVPAPVKSSNKEDLKELQAAAKDIQKMLPAQRERIDGLFLQQKSWPLANWRERYLNHPLVGTLARRILWEFKTDKRTAAGIWFKDRLVDLDLKPVEISDEVTVQLWHPIGKSTEEIIAWRGWLDTQQIQQPFKQAHREIYLLTDAERNTGSYSNRYAAHVLKQHQFNALCALRGWKNQLRLLVDAEYPPATLHLPQWGLRAEFWVEGVGTDYGADTNDSGVYHYLSTDQVRFYRVDAEQRMAHAGGGGYHPAYRGPDAEPLPVEQIPALVFSEVMRDVDMFVGVASVGNDPAWSDGGPDGRYQQYWRSYSFGELSASAKTRKDVLQRLVPKLKIASRCSFEDKFLVVRGSLRTYKIHLGSGNILMEPNDQYLCIVPQQYDSGGEGGVLLPFEGDRTLSIIISKALLLADDAKIKDGTILRQIEG